jgi:UDP-2,4-diacetamido-2,4,6-trideoxy-beta-L-altropyranose hydrolase
MAATRVLVFPDSGPRIGGGHAMRCLTLARALIARGAICAFAATPSTQAILQAFGAPDIEILPVLGAPDDAAAMAADRAWAFAADWVLLDHYFLNPEQEAALRAGRRLAVIDDLADRPRAADLLMDSAYGRTPEVYRPLLPPGAAILTGPAYAPVRPEFATRREAALARRREGGHLRHVLIALGLTDVEGITGRVVEALRPMLGDLILDVVVGGSALSLPNLCAAAKNDPHLRLHIDSREMAQLMAVADIAIGAGGSSTWERATLGLPTATVVLAGNQRPMARAMARDGLTLTADVADADFEDQLIVAVRRLIVDAALRRAMSEAAAAACDGRGADRFAQALLASRQA